MDEVRCTQTMTVGGSSEMLAKALTASPRGVSSSIVVTMVTPVTNLRLTCLIRSGSSAVMVLTSPVLR